MANVKGTADAAKNVAAKKVEETKAAVKTAAKAVEAKAEEVKTEVKAEAVKAEEKVAAVVKAEAEKIAPAKKEEAPEKKEEVPAKEVKAADKKKPGRKPGSKNKTAKPEKKETSHPEVFIQFGPGEASVGNVVERIRNEYVEQGHRLSSIKSLKVYLKPEDRSAYYVINEKVAGRVDLF